jgi:hypothetical protein
MDRAVPLYMLIVPRIVSRVRAGKLGFDSRQRRGFCSLRHRCVHTSSGARPASYPTGAGGYSLEGEEAGARS